MFCRVNTHRDQQDANWTWRRSEAAETDLWQRIYEIPGICRPSGRKPPAQEESSALQTQFMTFIWKKKSCRFTDKIRFWSSGSSRKPGGPLAEMSSKIGGNSGFMEESKWLSEEMRPASGGEDAFSFSWNHEAWWIRPGTEPGSVRLPADVLRVPGSSSGWSFSTNSHL